MNFPASIQVPALNSNHPAGHLLPRPVHRDHVMPVVVIVLFFIPRLVLFLDEWVSAHNAGWAEAVDGAAEFHTVTATVGFIDTRTNDPILDLPAIF